MTHGKHVKIGLVWVQSNHLLPFGIVQTIDDFHFLPRHEYFQV